MIFFFSPHKTDSECAHRLWKYIHMCSRQTPDPMLLLPGRNMNKTGEQRRGVCRPSSLQRWWCVRATIAVSGLTGLQQLGLRLLWEETLFAYLYGRCCYTPNDPFQNTFILQETPSLKSCVGRLLFHINYGERDVDILVFESVFFIQNQIKCLHLQIGLFHLNDRE